VIAALAYLVALGLVFFLFGLAFRHLLGEWRLMRESEEGRDW